MATKIARTVVVAGVVLAISGLLVDVIWAGDGTWTQVGPCFYGCNVNLIELARSKSTEVYARLDGELYKSCDGGATWSSSSLPLGPDTRLLDIAISYQDNERIYVSVWNSSVGSGGVYRSNDGGQVWFEILPESASKLAVAPSDHNVVYAVDWNSLYYTTDGGQAWTGPIGDWSNDLNSIEVDAHDPQTIYIATDLGVYRSTNGGVSSEHLSLHKPTNSLGLCSEDADLLYAGGDYGVFITEDGGDSWLQGGNLGTNLVWELLVNPLDCNAVYAGTTSAAVQGRGSGGPTPSSGVYRSLNRGRHWTAMNQGMGERDIYAIGIDTQQPQSLLVATQFDGAGIWKYTFGPAAKQDYGVTIQDGAKRTDSTDVTLSLTARPGTNEMLISNDGGFADSTWEPFAGNKDWTLEAYGGVAAPATVYAKFRTFGKVSGLYQDDIIVQSLGPVGGATLWADKRGLVLPWVAPGAIALSISLVVWTAWQRRHR